MVFFLNVKVWRTRWGPKKRTNKEKDEQMKEFENKQMDKRTEGQTNERTNTYTNEQMKDWTNRMNQRMNELTNETSQLERPENLLVFMSRKTFLSFFILFFLFFISIFFDNIPLSPRFNLFSPLFNACSCFIEILCPSQRVRVPKSVVFTV